MRDVQQIIIPTLSKAKISRHLSWPIGAKDVSIALAATAQLPVIKLHFYVGLDHQSDNGHFEFLRVEYLRQETPAEKWPIRRLYDRPPQYTWEIVVQPVPRVSRHRIRQYISDSALPRIAGWLIERTEFAQRGSDILAFFYDTSAKDEFTARQLTHLEPLRA